MGLNYVVLGGTSALVQATLKQIEKPSNFVLIGRHAGRLRQVADDLQARGHSSQVICCDVSWEKDKPELIWQKTLEYLKDIHVVIVGQGYLPQENSVSCEEFKKTMRFNFISIVEFLIPVKETLKKQKQGHIVVMTSVAGLRGRSSQYVYGSAKASMIHWLEGVRMELHPYHVFVTDVRPGPVWTPMTQHLEKGFLFAEDEDVGADILRGMQKKLDVIYTPRWWRIILLVICLIPSWIYKRLRF
ncbi:MAG: SDR family NAD(P)-dependent oxidoreductase [Oligoflexales bacterium]